jgi:hypothetical protein
VHNGWKEHFSYFATQKLKGVASQTLFLLAVGIFLLIVVLVLGALFATQQ